MDDILRKANEAEGIAYEGKQTRHQRKTRPTTKERLTPGTTLTSHYIESAIPSMDTNRYPDTSFVNTLW